MGVKWPKKGAKWRLLREPATLLIMTQLLCCHAVEIEALTRPEADSEISFTRRESGMVQLPDLRG